MCALENEKKNLEHAFLLEPGERPARHLTGDEALLSSAHQSEYIGKYPDPGPKLETHTTHTAEAYSGNTDR